MRAYISFDPGKNTGVAEWDENGVLLSANELYGDEPLDDYLKKVELEPPKVIIIEEYRVYGSVQHTGSKVETIQVIGNIKRTARTCRAKIVEQRADVKKISAAWSQTKIPKGHMPDWMAAYLHGYYYLHKIGKIKAKVLEDEG